MRQRTGSEWITRSTILFAALLTTHAAHADVTIQLSPQGQTYAMQLGIDPAELETQLEGKITDVFQLANINGMLRGFTDATSFSARGIGVDYASDPKSALFGVAANVAAAGDFRDKDRPTGGIAASIALMAGLNLSAWNHPRWTVYANGFYQGGSTDQLEGKITCLGAHVQYQIIPPSESGGTGAVVRWLGLSANSGIEFTRWSLGAGSDGVLSDFEIAGNGEDQAITYDATGRFDLTSTATTVPVEVTTGLRIALIAAVYVGAGVDVTVGKSTIATGLSGPLRAGDMEIGTASISASGSNSASPASARALAGVQLNLWKLKLFAQANASMIPAVSFGLGARLVF
ncbi:MAG: hypothetical protein AB7P03_28860 [Kofleriaceae bacterium]